MLADSSTQGHQLGPQCHGPLPQCPPRPVTSLLSRSTWISLGEAEGTPELVSWKAGWWPCSPAVGVATTRVLRLWLVCLTHISVLPGCHQGQARVHRRISASTRAGLGKRCLGWQPCLPRSPMGQWPRALLIHPPPSPGRRLQVHLTLTPGRSPRQLSLRPSPPSCLEGAAALSEVPHVHVFPD